jgi:hypothetical protein
MKYIDYLKSRGWKLSVKQTFQDADHVAVLEAVYDRLPDFGGTLHRLRGFGRTSDLALSELESYCKDYVVRIDRLLNIELVQS